MTELTLLSPHQLDRLRALASVLLPGSDESPAAGDLADFDQLVSQAVGALSGEFAAVRSAIEALPSAITQDSASSFSESDPKSFELVSLVLVGAYFMAAPVKISLGLPTVPRRAPSREQIVDELSDGLLDLVLERGSPIRTLDDVHSASN